MRLNTSTQQPADSLSSRRPARAALPPFTLPPPPDIPRAGTTSAADGVSPATGGVLRSSGESSSHSTTSASASVSSPGYSVAAMSSYSSPSQPSSQYSTTQYGPSSRMHTSPGRLQQPLAPKPPPGPPPKQHLQLSPALPPPTSLSRSSRFGERLPPISSLIPPSPPPPHHAASPRPMPPHTNTSGTSGGHLAPPAGIPLMTQTTLASPTFFRVPSGNVASRSNSSPGQYLEFNVGAYSVVRESSQQDRPFKCDMCTQCFSRNHDLKRHKRIHLAAKPFPCPHCHKCFSRKDALKRHSLVKACSGKKKDSPESKPEEENGTEDKSESKSPSPAASASETELETEVKAEPEPPNKMTDQDASRPSNNITTPEG